MLEVELRGTSLQNNISQKQAGLVGLTGHWRTLQCEDKRLTDGERKMRMGG